MSTQKPKLNLVPTSAPEIVSLQTYVEGLEECGGILDRFIQKYCPVDTEHKLYLIEKLLSQQVLVGGLQDRWQKALQISAKIRLDRLRCRALKMLETYQNLSTTSAATDISYCKTILSGGLMENIYRNPKDLNRDEDTNREDDPMREVEKDFEGEDNA